MRIIWVYQALLGEPSRFSVRKASSVCFPCLILSHWKDTLSTTILIWFALRPLIPFRGFDRGYSDHILESSLWRRSCNRRFELSFLLSFFLCHLRMRSTCLFPVLGTFYSLFFFPVHDTSLFWTHLFLVCSTLCSATARSNQHTLYIPCFPISLLELQIHSVRHPPSQMLDATVLLYDYCLDLIYHLFSSFWADSSPSTTKFPTHCLMYYGILSATSHF